MGQKAAVAIQSSAALAPDAIAVAFQRAVEAAERHVGATAPNPPVGCAVLDRRGELLAIAAHEGSGKPHAEARAIDECRQADTLQRMHTLVVTLEPCNHHGLTAPCTDAILATPVQSVWVGARDPNPNVTGGGSRVLAAAGLAVHEIGALPHPDATRMSERATRLIAPFTKLVCKGLPWVTVKQALDPNGSMIPPPGQKTFTSPSSLACAHRLRRRADAIVTGSGTVLADDPAFTVRCVTDIPGKRRHLIILDRRRRVPKSYLTAARNRGFDVRIADDFRETLGILANDGVLEVLVEAGPTLTRHILATGDWDRHVVISQAVTAGGADTISISARDHQSKVE